MHRRDILGGAFASLLLAACTPREEARCPEPQKSAPPPPLPDRRPTIVTPKNGDKIRVLCIGAHPDDPETACGGTLARYAEAGHDVHVLYMTKGELGIVGKSPDEAGAIRSAEAEEGCKALGAKAHFFGHPSGAIKFDRPTADQLVAKLDAIAPDLVLSHWPIDTEYDHQIVAALALHAWLAKPRRHPLFLYEVEAGTQSLGFVPHAYVEIGNQLPKKLAAIRAHKSQEVERRAYEKHHEPMERFRAREIAGVAAEAYAVLSPEARMGTLPGL
jgi:LmbE family N-acetylglucosaminyl deacetylase